MDRPHPGDVVMTAMDQFRRTVQAYPDSHDKAAAVAWIQRRQEAYEAALAAAVAAVRADPDYPDYDPSASIDWGSLLKR
jgi:thioredoxin-like negative regulator of GroEL